MIYLNNPIFTQVTFIIKNKIYHKICRNLLTKYSIYGITIYSYSDGCVYGCDDHR